MGQNCTRKPITVGIVEKIADREEVDQTDLEPPLGTVIDADALESLFHDSVTGNTRDGIQVEFSYLGYTVTVFGGTDIRISAN